jgi:hypothetical protein
VPASLKPDAARPLEKGRGFDDDIANAVSGVVGAVASGRGSAWMNLIWD